MIPEFVAVGVDIASNQHSGRSLHPVEERRGNAPGPSCDDDAYPRGCGNFARAAKFIQSRGDSFEGFQLNCLNVRFPMTSSPIS